MGDVLEVGADAGHGDDTAWRVLEYLRAKLPEMTQLLTELVSLESPSSEPAAQAPVLDRMAAELRRLGCRTRRLRGGTSGGQLLGYRSGGRGPHRQLLVGHSDTVWPRGTIADMPTRLEDGRLFGPGVYDMKAGLVQIVFAYEALRALDLQPAVVPVVFINSDEEIGSLESRRAIRRLSRIVDRALVLEPSLGPEGKLKTARKGVGRFTVRVVGRAAHAGLEPEKGASAILELSVIVQRLFALNGRIDGVTVNVGKIDGGLRPNVVAPESSAVVDVRAPTRRAAREIESSIRAIEPSTPDTRVVIEGGFGRPPMEKTRASRELWRRAHAAAARLGLSLDEATAGGGSDGNLTSQFAPTLDGLGAVGEGAHAPSECIRIDSLPERTSLLTLLMLEPPLGETRR